MWIIRIEPPARYELGLTRPSGAEGPILSVRNRPLDGTGDLWETDPPWAPGPRGELVVSVPRPGWWGVRVISRDGSVVERHDLVVAPVTTTTVSVPAPTWPPRVPGALGGVLRIGDSATFRDDARPVLPVFCHAGDLLALFLRDRDWATRELDDIARAGYHGVRTWTVLAGPYWDSLGRTIGPDDERYWDAVVAFRDALRDRRLRWIVSQGDAMRAFPRQADRRAFLRDLARAVGGPGGLLVVSAVDAGNEAWQNGEDDPLRLRDALDAFLGELDVPVWSLTSPQGEEPQGLARYAGTVYDVHGARHGHLADKLRHAFSIGYEAAGRDGVPRLGIQSEPPGPGPLVSVTEHKEELDDDGCVLLAAMHLMARQATVYFSSPGVSVRERGEFSRSPGFWTVPQVRDVLPSDLMAWPTLIHGGERWRGVRVWRADGTTRVDQAIAEDGRVVAIAYAPDGPPVLAPERPVVVQRVAGEGSARGRLIVGRLA